MSDAITIPDRDERIGTARQEFVAKLEEKDPELAKAFEEMTPEQKAAGKLMGLLDSARGYQAIEDAFTWYEQETHTALDIFQRLMAMYVALEHSGCQDRVVYNAARKILITVNTR